MNGIRIDREATRSPKHGERAMVRLFERVHIKTQYDKPTLARKDARYRHIHDPLAEPMIHRDFPRLSKSWRNTWMESAMGSRTIASAIRAIRRIPLGIHLSSAAVRLRSAHARADRSDRARLPPVGRDALHPPAQASLEGVGGQPLLRPGLLAEASGAGVIRRTTLGPEHDVRFAPTTLQGGLYEHVRADPLQARIAAEVGSFPARPCGWAATATWPTAFTSTARTWPNSRGVSWGHQEADLRRAHHALRRCPRDHGGCRPASGSRARWATAT